MKMKFVFILFIACFGSSAVISADELPCGGGWEQYKDEHCYRLFDGVQSYADSEKICQSHNSTLVSIHFAEEQHFLVNYIFTKRKAVDNVWIGAKYVGNKQFKWADHTSLAAPGSYSNWAAGNPKYQADHCVEMLADEAALGRWTEERCAKRNMVVCQREQPISVKLLAETVLALKHSLQQAVGEQAEMKKEMAKLKKESIPVGFTYVQLPKDKAPGELWPGMTWRDVSADYQGVFFRVVGGEAASFGQVQLGSAPRLATVHNGYLYNQGTDIIQTPQSYPSNVSVPLNGDWSDGIYTGGIGGGHSFYMNFKLTGDVEVRPKNMAIKVYRRTA